MYKVRYIVVLVLAVGVLCIPLAADAKTYKVVRDSQGRAIGLKDPSDNIFKRVLRAATLPRLRRRLAVSTGFGPAITQRQMQAPATATQQATGLVDSATGQTEPGADSGCGDGTGGSLDQAEHVEGKVVGIEPKAPDVTADELASIVPAPSHLRLILAVLLTVLAVGAGFCDALTPSGTAAQAESSSTPLSAGEPVDFEQAASRLSYTFPIELNTFPQVVQNSYNWQGPADASVKAEIGFTGDTVVVRGQMCDDHPLFQTMLNPAKPLWWQITYGADGVELILDDPTSSAQRVQMVLNFGAHGVNPRVEVLSSPFRAKPGFAETAALLLSSGEDLCAPNGQPVMRFDAAIPYAELAPARFFEKSVIITLRLHDMDGDPSTYLMMQGAIEARPPVREP